MLPPEGRGITGHFGAKIEFRFALCHSLVIAYFFEIALCCQLPTADRYETRRSHFRGCR